MAGAMGYLSMCECFPMSDVFQLSDALSSELVEISPAAEKVCIRNWLTIDADIQFLLIDQPSLSSVIGNEFKATFPALATVPEPEHLLIVPGLDDSVPGHAQASPPDLPLSVIDTVLQTLHTGVFASYPAQTIVLRRAGQATDIELDLARFELFLADMRRYLGSYFRLQTTDFWLASCAQTGNRSRKEWLLDQLASLLRAESAMLNVDTTLTPEQVSVVDLVVRYPSLATRAALAVYSRPAVYALRLKGQDGLGPIYFAGAFVITQRDGSGFYDQFGAFTVASKNGPVEIDARAQAGVTVLYTPSGGLQGFNTLQALEDELERRWRAVSEFESMLELTSPTDLLRIEALGKVPQASFEWGFDEIYPSIFEHWYRVHDDQRQQNIIHLLSHTAAASIAQLEDELAHVVDYAHRFSQTNAFAARLFKRISLKTRAWLVSASPEDRESWLEAVERYKTHAFIANEDGEPSSHQFGDKAFLLRYAREQIQQHIQLEYGLSIDPDALFITTTAAEAGAGAVIPAGSLAPSSYTAVNSLSRTGPSIRLVSTTRTMTQLALENVSKFDIDYALTARVTTGSASGPQSLQLSPAQVKTIIRTVNIGDSYQAFLQDKLIDSPMAVSRRETAMQLMIAQMRLDALEAKISGDFSPDRLDRGYRWVEAVLDEAQNPQAIATVEGHAIKVHQLLVGETTVRGVLIISAHSLSVPSSASELELPSLHPQFSVSSIVVYTPEAPDGKRFREFENRSHMAGKFLHEAQFTDYLVGRVSAGHHVRIRHLFKQGLRAPDVKLLPIAGNFIEQACIAQARHAIANADAVSNSTTELNGLCVWNSIELAVDIVTAVLPLKVTAPIALARSLLSLWNGFDALKRDSQLEALGHFVGMIAHLVDAGVDIAVVVARVPLTRAIASPAALDSRLAYSQGLTDLTLRSDGVYAGVYEKVPKQGGFSQYFVQQEKYWYQIKYDKDRLVWRVMDMRRPQAWYRSPISQGSDGLWRVSTPQLSLRGGGRSTLAPYRVRVALPHFSLEEARKLLDQYNFPETLRTGLELDLAEYLVKHKTLPLWSQQYLKPGLEAARLARLQQTGGTSSRTLLSNKRKAAQLAQEPPVARPPQPTPSISTPLASASDQTSWQSWGQKVDPGLSSMASINPPIFKVSSPQGTYRAIKLDDLHFEILPQGHEAQTQRVFLKHPHKPCNNYDQLEALLRYGKHEQPRMGEFTGGRWVIHEPFFYKPILNIVSNVFPSMTAQSQRELSRRLFHFADPSSTGITPNRMLNTKQALYGWLSGNSSSLSVHLGDPCALLAQATRVGEGLYQLGTQVRASIFNRMDFKLLASEHTLLTNVTTNPSLALNEVMTSLLRRLGYEIYPGMTDLSVMAFRRRGAKTMNFMQLHKIDSPRILLTKALGDTVDELIRHNPLSPLALALSSARAEGKLLFLLGGVQHSAPTALPVGFVFRV